MDGSSRAGVNRAQTIRLSIQYVDQARNFIDPNTIPTLTILDPNNVIILSVNKDTGVIRQDLGLYYYDFSVPLTAALGTWKDYWAATSGGVSVNINFSFVVNLAGGAVTAEAGQEIDPLLSSSAITNVLDLMKLLRTRLGADGVRRKRDQFGRYILDANGQYITEACNVFSTDQLYTFLKASLSEFNSIPHFTSFTFDNIWFVQTFKHELTEGAVIMAWALQAVLERGREVVINDDGLSYQPPAISEILRGEMNDIMTKYQERLKFIKCQFKPYPKGIDGFPAFGGGQNPAVIRLKHLRARQIF